MHSLPPSVSETFSYLIIRAVSLKIDHLIPAWLLRRTSKRPSPTICPSAFPSLEIPIGSIPRLFEIIIGTTTTSSSIYQCYPVHKTIFYTKIPFNIQVRAVQITYVVSVANLTHPCRTPCCNHLAGIALSRDLGIRKLLKCPHLELLSLKILEPVGVACYKPWNWVRHFVFRIKLFHFVFRITLFQLVVFRFRFCNDMDKSNVDPFNWISFAFLAWWSAFLFHLSSYEEPPVPRCNGYLCFVESCLLFCYVNLLLLVQSEGVSITTFHCST